MSRGEIRITGSKKQTEALKNIVERLYPEYESVQEFIKDSISRRLNTDWNNIQQLSDSLR